jgi:cytochrome c2
MTRIRIQDEGGRSGLQAAISPRKLLSVWAFAIALVPSLHAEPFANGDAQAGEKLFNERECARCHVSMLGGDGSEIFVRANRKVKTAPQLLTQIRACNNQLGIQLFPEDEENLAAYLNQKYYKFSR